MVHEETEFGVDSCGLVKSLVAAPRKHDNKILS